jgi:hypothetical protein
VSDGWLSASQVVAIAVTAGGANNPPVLTLEPLQQGVANTVLTFTPQVSDPDGDPVTVTGQNLPSGATMASPFTWTPTVAQVGAYVINVLASDGKTTVAQPQPLLVVHPDYDWLAGSKLFAWMLVGNKVYVYAFRCPDRTSLVIAFCAPGTQVSLGTTSGMTRTDLYNQTVNPVVIGSQAVLFHSAKRVGPRQALDMVVGAITP